MTANMLINSLTNLLEKDRIDWCWGQENYNGGQNDSKKQRDTGC